MRSILELDRYPLDAPGTPEWRALVERCRADLATEGMFNLEGLVKPDALVRAMSEIKPVMETLSFVHKRSHNIYFRNEVPGMAPDHPTMRKVDTVNHTVCSDQIPRVPRCDVGEGCAVHHARSAGASEHHELPRGRGAELAF